MDEVHPLRKWRKANNLSQAAVGDAVGVTAEQISQVETGAKWCSYQVATRVERLTAGEVPIAALMKGGASSEAAA